MKEVDTGKEEFQIPGRTFHEPEFATEDGKARFKVVQIPHFSSLEKGEPPPSPLLSEEGETLRTKKPSIPSIGNWFRLMTVRSEGQFNTIIYEEKDLFRGQTERWVVLMNKKDIENFGLKENDKVTLKNEIGEMKDVKVREFDIRKGNLMAYFPEANVLISTETDERSKTPAFKSARVNVLINS